MNTFSNESRVKYSPGDAPEGRDYLNKAIDEQWLIGPEPDTQIETYLCVTPTVGWFVAEDSIYPLLRGS